MATTPPLAHNNTASLMPPLAPADREPTGTIWIDFGDGGSARWAGLSTETIDEVCAYLETVKQPDTLT